MRPALMRRLPSAVVAMIGVLAVVSIVLGEHMSDEGIHLDLFLALVVALNLWPSALYWLAARSLSSHPPVIVGAGAGLLLSAGPMYVVAPMLAGGDAQGGLFYLFIPFASGAAMVCGAAVGAMYERRRRSLGAL